MMSRKHNAPHPERGKSRYKERLAKRGLRASPLEDLETLRRRARYTLEDELAAEQIMQQIGSQFVFTTRTPEPGTEAVA